MAPVLGEARVGPNHSLNRTARQRRWCTVRSRPIGISMGAFDGATETHTELHIFAAEKGDYYEITDGLPQYERIPQ